MNLTIPKFNNLKERSMAFTEAAFDVIDKKTVDRIIQETDFLTAPASTKFHGAYEGGLFDHSYAVMEALKFLTKSLNLKWEDPGSPVKVGLFHDFCKLDCYIKQEEGTYSWNSEQLLSGHGDKSVITAQEFVTLNTEEIACIRYHMGAFTEQSEWEYYSRAIQQFPNVLYTHTADMIASKIMGV